MDQKGQYLAQNDQKSIFWGKYPNYFGREQKFWYPHIRKPVRHLVRIVFLVGLGTKWIRKANIWPKITQNTYFFGIRISGNLLDTCFVLRILASEASMGRSERKSAIYTQKFWYFGPKVIFCLRAPDFAYDLFVALARRSISHLWTSARGLDKFLHKNINHQKCIQKQNCYKLYIC